MKLRNIAYATAIAMTAAAFVIGSAAPSDAKSKKKAEAAAPPPVCWFAADQPVCGTKGGMKFTYSNACNAAKDGAKVVANKACPTMKAMKGGGMKKAAKAKAKPGKKK